MLDRLRGPFGSGAARARDRSLLEAAMASAAWIAATDERVSLARRHALDQILDSVEPLRVVEVHAAVDLFDGFLRELRATPQQGQTRVMKAVTALAGQADAGALLVRIAGAVARADGAVSADARERVAEIATILGVAPPDLTPQQAAASVLDPAQSTVIVLGNEKGGTGKSTTAMHLAVALADAGHRVGCVDLDGRQGTLTRYMSNRKAFAKKYGRDIAIPRHRRVERAQLRDREAAHREERARLDAALADLTDCRVVVIDTPGSDSHLGRIGHGLADVLITPLNDSFLDIDVLARIDRERREVVEPSAYSQLVRTQNEQRLAAGRRPIDWIVMRNRLAHIDARNTREMAQLLDLLSRRMRFRLQPGFSERVVFRELFYHGLTLLDLPEDPSDPRGNASHRRARRELGDLVAALDLREAQ